MQRLRIIAGGFMLSVACGGSPTAPSPANVAGAWTGRYVVARCSDTTVLNLCPQTTDGPFALTLIQSGGLVSGTMTVGLLSGGVTGTVTSTGQITMDTWSTARAFPAGGTVVWRLSSIVFTATGTSLSGTFHMNQTNTVSNGAYDADCALSGVVKG